MSTQRLRLTGPRGLAYVLGDPIEVLDGQVLIGRVQSLTPSADGTEVFAENFLTVDFAEFRVGALPKLVLAEVVAFIAECYPSIHTIVIELSRDIEGYEGREAVLAGARTLNLQSIGAQDIRVTPKPHAGQAGHFAVTGVWHYDAASLAALESALATQRAAYFAEKAELVEKAGKKVEAPKRPGLGQLFRKDR